MPRLNTRSTVLLAAALAPAVLAAPAVAPAAPQGVHAAKTTTFTLTSPANGDTRFSRTKLTATHGTIVLRLRNPSFTDHAIALGSKEGPEVSDSGVSRITLRLKKGRYTYFCPVSDHRALGMRGTLTVR